MKVLPRKTWSVKFSRELDLGACGFVNGDYREPGLSAWSPTFHRRSRCVSVHIRAKSAQKVNRFVERIRKSKRMCRVVRKFIHTRDFEFLVPFNFDSVGVLRDWNKPRSTWGYCDISFRFVGNHQVVHFLRLWDHSSARQCLANLMPILKRHRIARTEIERMKHVIEAPTLIELDQRHRWMIRARECDRVLALITKVGADAVLARVLEFNHL